ncbi:MAG: DUF3108 domain-containing protein [Candidatus Omnitrophota bacterium]
MTELSPRVSKKTELQFAFNKGETINYAIKSFGLKAGNASLSFQGITQYNGQDVYLIVFRAEALNFLDEETIYADTTHLYPVLIKRNLNIWGKKEKIDEFYDQEKGTVKIVKYAGDQTQEQVIEKDGRIDNIYCFIYRTRQSDEFQVGDSFVMRLPTKDVKIELMKETQLKAAGRKYKTYYMQSDPAQYEVWFDTSAMKIPLCISGSVGIKATNIIMVNYEAGG